MSGSRLRRYLSEALRLLRQRRFSVLWDKSLRMADAMAARVSVSDLEAACAEASPLVCIVDSAQGGGAAIAAARSASAWREQGFGTLHLGCDPMGSITVNIILPGEATPALSGRLSGWPVLPASVSAMEIHSLAGFTKPDVVATWLTDAMTLINDKTGLCAADEMAYKPHAATVHWHDHYPVCPTRHLLNAESRYCGIPDPTICVSCLPNNPHCLDAPLRSVDIVAWREQWGQVLAGASSIRVFSPSSRELLCRVWPEHDSKVVLAPHDTRHIRRSRMSPAPESALHIGVVGRIASHKGAAQVAGLARYIAETGANARITVFGTLEEPAPASVVAQTGAYQAEALPTLCAERGVNVFWFPSIWPETFSFVVHEMKAMRLPVLAYDVGAQADALADDSQHRMMSLNMGPEDILATLIDMRSASL